MNDQTQSPMEGEPLIRPSSVDHPLHDDIVAACLIRGDSPAAVRSHAGFNEGHLDSRLDHVRTRMSLGSMVVVNDR